MASRQKLSRLIRLLCATSFAWVHAAALPRPAGLWPLNTAHPLQDISGFRRHAVANAPVTYDTESGGPPEGGLRLSSVDTPHLTVPDGACLRLQRDFTIAFLIKLPTVAGIDNGGYPVEFKSDNGNRGFRIFLTPTLRIKLFMIQQNNTEFTKEESTNTIEFDKWNFVALSYNATNELLTFQTNDTITLFSQKVINLKSDMEMVIGRGLPFQDLTFVASMSCLQIYIRALDPDQLTEAASIAWAGCVQLDFNLKSIIQHRQRLVRTGQKMGTATGFELHSQAVNKLIECTYICAGLCGCVSFDIQPTANESYYCRLFKTFNEMLLVPSPDAMFYTMAISE